MPRDLHDHYFRQAKREGYRSRAAYKLLEIDERKSVLRAGDRVLDCGAAPGAWLQVASRAVGARGRVVGIDLKRIEPLPDPGIVLIEGDLREMSADDLLAPIRAGDPSARYDVVLSDMAPSTTGDRTIDHFGSVRLCHAVLDRCPDLLAAGGRLVMKVFEGEAYPDLLERTAATFERARGFRPKASRGESTEMFVVAHGFRPAAAPGPSEAPPPPAPGPPSGWRRT